jgi:hypothetical protein
MMMIQTMFQPLLLRFLVLASVSVGVDISIICLLSGYNDLTNKDTLSLSRTAIYDTNPNMQKHL